jgi:hypothetical protein
MRETYPHQVDEDSHALPCYLTISSTRGGGMDIFYTGILQRSNGHIPKEPTSGHAKPS